jgi:thioredoxin-related protein
MECDKFIMKKFLTLLLIAAIAVTVSYVQAQQEKNPDEPNPAQQVKKPDAPNPEEGWLTSLEKAKEQAVKEEKDILVDFTGSDWCGWCIKLNKEVFSTEAWKQAYPKKYVMVIVDFPRTKALSDEQKAYNEKLGMAFGVEGYPTIFLLDSVGKAYAKTGYQAGGATGYLQHLEELGKQKKERDTLLQQAKETAADKKLELLDKLLNAMESWEVSFAYLELKEEVVALDIDNKAKLQSKYAIHLAQHYYSLGNQEKSTAYLNIVKKYDASKAQEIEIQFKLQTLPAQYFEKNDWKGAQEAMKPLLALNPQGESGQLVYYYAGVVEYQLNNAEQCVKYLEKAVECAPDSKVVVYLQRALAKLKQEKSIPKNPEPKTPEPKNPEPKDKDQK